MNCISVNTCLFCNKSLNLVRNDRTFSNELFVGVNRFNGKQIPQESICIVKQSTLPI